MKVKKTCATVSFLLWSLIFSANVFAENSQLVSNNLTITEEGDQLHCTNVDKEALKKDRSLLKYLPSSREDFVNAFYSSLSFCGKQMTTYRELKDQVPTVTVGLLVLDYAMKNNDLVKAWLQTKEASDFARKLIKFIPLNKQAYYRDEVGSTGYHYSSADVLGSASSLAIQASALLYMQGAYQSMQGDSQSLMTSEYKKAADAWIAGRMFWYASGAEVIYRSFLKGREEQEDVENQDSFLVYAWENYDDIPEWILLSASEVGPKIGTGYLFTKLYDYVGIKNGVNFLTNGLLAFLTTRSNFLNEHYPKVAFLTTALNVFLQQGISTVYYMTAARSVMGSVKAFRNSDFAEDLYYTIFPGSDEADADKPEL